MTAHQKRFKEYPFHQKLKYYFNHVAYNIDDITTKVNKLPRFTDGSCTDTRPQNYIGFKWKVPIS